MDTTVAVVNLTRVSSTLIPASPGTTKWYNRCILHFPVLRGCFQRNYIIYVLSTERGKNVYENIYSILLIICNM